MDTIILEALRKCGGMCPYTYPESVNLLPYGRFWDFPRIIKLCDRPTIHVLLTESIPRPQFSKFKVLILEI
jgi:hypothetical protein